MRPPKNPKFCKLNLKLQVPVNRLPEHVPADLPGLHRRGPGQLSFNIETTLTVSTAVETCKSNELTIFPEIIF